MPTTTIKFHKADNGKLVRCKAEIKCRKGAKDHINLDREQAKFMKDVLGVDIQIPREAPKTKDAPKKVPNPGGDHDKTIQELIRQQVDQALQDQEFQRENGITREEMAALGEGPSQFGDLAQYGWTSAIDYDYDSYDTPEWEDDDDGYGRNRQYQNLRVDPNIDAERVAYGLFNPKTDTALKAAVAFVQASGLDKADAYEAEADWGYYGQEARVEITAEAREKATTWFNSFGNSDDSDGFYTYARAVGVNTAGMSKRQAVIAAVLANHPDLPLATQLRVNQAEVVSLQSLHTRQFKLQPEDLAAYDTAEPIGARTKAPIATVLHDPVNETFTVVDGFENVKRMNATPTGNRKYIVLHLPDPRPRDRWGRPYQYGGFNKVGWGMTLKRIGNDA